MRASRAGLVPVVCVAVSCAATPKPVTYVQASPAPEAPKPPPVIAVPTPLPLPGQLQRTPALPEHHRGEKRPSWEVIEDANRKAAVGPDREGYFNAITTYDFADGALFQLYTAPLRLTAIELEPGEKIVGKPAAGDTLRWVMGIGHSGTPPNEQQHLYVKPTRAGLHTTMVVTTDRRTYYLELHSFDETYMASVRWRYPQDEVAQLETSAAAQEAAARDTTATRVDLGALNFGYTIAVEKGKPVWTPTQVFDDGRKTFIRFPAAMLVREAPALFVVTSTNETALVNYRVKNDTYVVDRLVERAELRIGQKDQEIVRITRTP